jgi:hypothetical protein
MLVTLNFGENLYKEGLWLFWEPIYEQDITKFKVPMLMLTKD